MKKAGKIIAAIFASLCIVVSLIVAGVALGGNLVQENPDIMQEGMEEVGDTMSESEKESMEAVQQIIGDADFDTMIRQGVVGAILSVIVLVTVLINVSSMPMVTPAVASVAALGGAIYCGIVIAIFMVPALIGSVLVLVANLKESKATDES